MSEHTTTHTTFNSYKRKNRFVVFHKESILSIKVTDVSLFTLENGSVHIFTFSGKVFPVKKSLSEIEMSLDPNLFFRVSRSAIVSYEAIERVEAFFGQRAVVFLKPSGKELVTKGRLTDFLEWLDQ